MRHFGEGVEEEAILSPEDWQDEEDAADGDEECELPDGHTGRGRKDFRKRNGEDRDGVAGDVAKDEDGFERIGFEDPKGVCFIIIVGAFDGVFGEDGGDTVAGAFRRACIVARVVDVMRIVGQARFGFGVDARANVVMNLNIKARGMLLIDIGNFGRCEWNADEEKFVCAARDDGGVVKARIGAEDAGCDAALGGGSFATDGNDPIMEDGAVGVESLGKDRLDGKVVVGAAGVAVNEGRG